MDRRIAMLASAALAGACLLVQSASAQISQGPKQTSGPIDITANTADRFDEKHLAIYKGDVEAVQNGARLICDELQIYSWGPDGSPDGKPGATAVKPVAGTTPAAGGQDDSFGSVKQVIAIGHVFYVTQTQSARGEHAVYDAEPDTITMTGNVTVVQGENVAKGDKMVIDRKTGHTTLISNATGRNKPERTRTVLYNNGTSSTQSGSQPTTQTPASAKPSAPAPAKKP